MFRWRLDSGGCSRHILMAMSISTADPASDVAAATATDVILFDGVCNLCQSSVQFVIARDPGRRFRFASLQSEIGRRLLAAHDVTIPDLSSVILIADGRVHTKSSAALRVCRRLSGAWPLMAVFLALPAFIRNAVYDFVGNRRYRWFGKKDVCWVPTADLSDRFLDQGQEPQA